MFTVVAVETYLKVNRATVYRLMWHHGLQSFRIGAHWYFDIETVERSRFTA